MSQSGQRPPLPDQMRRFAWAAAGNVCLGCGGNVDLRVAHLRDQAAIKTEMADWRRPIFDRTYPWMYANAFNNLGNIALLCKPCEDRREVDEDYKRQVDQAWCAAMRRAARSGLLLHYFYNGYARAYDNAHAARLHGPEAKVTGLSQEDFAVCMGFLHEAAQSGEVPAEFVVLPIGGAPRDRTGRFHHHVNLVDGGVSGCAADHDECARRSLTWSPATGFCVRNADGSSAGRWTFPPPS